MKATAGKNGYLSWAMKMHHVLYYNALTTKKYDNKNILKHVFKLQ